MDSLQLSYLGISSIQPGAFRRYSGLGFPRTLHLVSNDIASLEPGAFDGLESLESLYFCGNPLRCAAINRTVLPPGVCDDKFCL